MTAAGRAGDIWLQVAKTNPRLGKHIKVFSHVFRGKRWYILQDETNGKYFRLDSPAYQFLGLLDGKRSVETVQAHLNTEDSSGLSKADITEVLSQLVYFGALRGFADREATQLLAQYNLTRRQSLHQKLLSPLVIRFPLYNPDSLVTRMVAWTHPVCNMAMLIVLMCVVCFGFVLTWGSWPDIKYEFMQRTLKPSNLLLLWILYPLVKCIHEFAHAYCVKRWGGDVNEMGITLLVMTPVPYVDASAAWAFKSKYKRMLVSGAGVLAELVLASVSLLIWVLTEPGYVHDCAFGIFVIGSFSTLVFNANPLLKFDGYYVLQDFLEIPNLYSRSTKYLQYQLKKRVLGCQSCRSPVTDPGEPAWFMVYGVLALIYRLVLVVVIVLMVSSKYLVLGVLLAMLALYQQLLKPIVAAVKFFRETQDRDRNSKVMVRATVVSVTLLIAVTLLPLPSTTRVQGVVWVPEQGQIFVQAAGFVDQVLVKPGQNVIAGQALMTLKNVSLERDIEILDAGVEALEIQSIVSRIGVPALHTQLKLDLATREAELEEKLALQETLTIRAASEGRFSVPSNGQLRGRYYSQGDLIGHIINPDRWVVRAVVPEKNSGLFLKGVTGATVRLAENPGRSLEATLTQQTPSADNQLPSAALGAGGGGPIDVNLDDPSFLTSVERVFHVELGLPAGESVFGVGERAYVSLKHKAEPLISRWARGFRQLFLRTMSA